MEVVRVIAVRHNDTQEYSKTRTVAMGSKLEGIKLSGSEPVDTHSITHRPNADAIEGATEPCLLGDAAAEGATEDGRKPDTTEGATEPCRCRSHNLSFARTSMFSNGAA